MICTRLLARAVATLAALIAVTTATGCGGSDSHPAAPAGAAAKANAELPSGRIAFRRWLDSGKTKGVIFTVQTDGTAEQQLTHPNTGYSDDFPDWSPDGRLIAYQRCPTNPALMGEPCTVRAINPDSRTEHQVRFHCRRGGCDASRPGWTPDGRIIATFEQGRVRQFDDGPQIQQSAIEAIDLRSGRQRTIHKRTGWAGVANDPQVSPDGRTVIYTQQNSARSKPPYGAALFAVGLDGSDHHQLASWELGGGDHASFSPGGTVLFRSFEGDSSKQSDYWTVHPDGSGLKQLTHFKPGTLVLKASYSPDGAWIVYGSDHGQGKADLFVMRADGTGSRQFTSTEWWDSAPDWEP